MKFERQPTECNSKTEMEKRQIMKMKRPEKYKKMENDYHNLKEVLNVSLNYNFLVSFVTNSEIKT